MSLEMSIEVVRVKCDTELQEAFSVRMQVFVIEQKVPEEEELDAYDASAIHLLARVKTSTQDSKIVGTARLLDKGNGLGKIGRVAVLKEYRGMGVGAALMAKLEMTTIEEGFREIVLEAQLHAIPFYEKLGYIAEGGIFLDANIEHRLMRKSNPDVLPE